MSAPIQAAGLAVGLALLVLAWNAYRNPVMDLMLAANIFCQ